MRICVRLSNLRHFAAFTDPRLEREREIRANRFLLGATPAGAGKNSRRIGELVDAFKLPFAVARLQGVQTGVERWKENFALGGGRSGRLGERAGVSD